MRVQLKLMSLVLGFLMASNSHTWATDLFGVQFTSGSSPQAANYNLSTANGSSTESVIDWSVWGEGSNTSLNANDRKSGGTDISSVTNLDPNATPIPLRALGQLGNFGTFGWTDGSPTTTASNVRTGIQHNTSVSTAQETQNVGFSFDVSGSPSQTRYLYVWFASHSGNTKLTATLNGATPVTYDLLAAQNLDKYGMVELGFKPGSVSDLLNIKVEINGTVYDRGDGQYFSNTYFNGVMLTTAVPEPSTYALGAIATGVLGFVARHRKARWA